MKYLLLLCSLLFSSLFFTASAQDTIKQSENIFAEMSANISYYNSLSIYPGGMNVLAQNRRNSICTVRTFRQISSNQNVG